MDQVFNISSFCHIRKNGIVLNGTPFFSSSAADFNLFIKEAAQHIKLNYPKFYKMDKLSKLAFLAAEVLLGNSEHSDKNNMALVLSNKSSSRDIDRKHQTTINDPENFFPSPSIFVYTLPNICIGEISIRHQLFSENCFFIFEAFNADHLFINAESLLKSNKAEKVLCGWADFDGDYEAFLYLVEKHGKTPHTPTEIKRLYTS